jgi:hypothetical protein
LFKAFFEEDESHWPSVLATLTRGAVSRQCGEHPEPTPALQKGRSNPAHSCEAGSAKRQEAQDFVDNCNDELQPWNGGVGAEQLAWIMAQLDDVSRLARSWAGLGQAGLGLSWAGLLRLG